MYRDTYIEVDLKNIEHNVKNIINKYNNYKYYFGVVKADCYGMGSLSVTEYIIKGGANYLAVASLEEALEIREKYNNIPILCLGVIQAEYINVAVQNNITLTISSYEYLNTIKLEGLIDAKVHIKINTGMNRLGVSSNEEFMNCYNTLKDKNIYIEGIYSHIYNANNIESTHNQFQIFEEITSGIDLSSIPIVHIQASDATTNFDKPKYVNGCRLGIVMYGFTSDIELDLKTTFKLYSKVIQINNLKQGDIVGYNGIYKATKSEKIAVIPIGYADGVIRKNSGREVYIKNKPYEIIGNVCMDMLFVKVDDSISLFDKVEIIKDKEHAQSVAKHLDTIVYEVMCSLGKRIPRIYKK